MTCKVYVAAPLGSAYRAREWGERLRMAETFCPVSTWHDTVTETVDPTDESTRRDVLLTNLCDLDRADCVLALMSWGTPRGAHNEIGYALAMSKPVVWLVGSGGEGMSIFTAHALVTLVSQHSQILPALYRVAHDISETGSATRLRMPSQHPPGGAAEAFVDSVAKLKAGGAR